MGQRINWQQMIAPDGSPTPDYRARFGLLSGGRFPVAPGDNERGEAALAARGNDTSQSERAYIIRAVAGRCPDLSRAAQQALDDDRKEGKI